jgi:hypothetical protein
MVITLSSEDFRKLSAACQRELLAFFTTGSREATVAQDPESYDDDRSVGPDIDVSNAIDATADQALEERRVVDIDVEEAQMLIANISEESLQTLRMFATGQPVALEDLIGEDRPYRDYAYLKRSFVGAVNRRLRTVMKKQNKNRSAMLFARIRDDENRIRINPRSAASLRQALNMAEPLPIQTYRDDAGNVLSRTDSNVVKLKKALDSAWKDFPGRPSLGRRAFANRIESATYFISCGFRARVGAHVEHSDGNMEFILSDEPSESWMKRIDDRGEVLLLQDGQPIWPADIYIVREDAPAILAELET